MVPQQHYALDDPYFVSRLKRLIYKYPIDYIVETGVNEGKSTFQLSYMAPFVLGIDIDPVCVAVTDDRLTDYEAYNYELIIGSSPDILKQVVPELPDTTLFFLDAHWGEHVTHHWVLPDEIMSLRPGKGVIALHDIKVPGKDFGYDSYEHEGKIKVFEYESIKEYLDKWSPYHEIEYPDQAAGGYRGTALIFPDKRRTTHVNSSIIKTLASKPNPISRSILSSVKERINNLPKDLPLPQIVGHDDGSVTFTYIDGNGTVLKTEILLPPKQPA